MAYYYKISDGETLVATPLEGIQVYKEKEVDFGGPSITFDFSKHVLIELLDNVTAEDKLWLELGLSHNKNITHKRMIVDPHRVNCRRAVVVCSSSNEAKELTQRLSQAKIMKRSICAVVIQELLSDICLFEKQIIQYGDKQSQHQLVYVTELTRRREPSGLAQYLREKFSPFGTILSVLVSEDKDGYAYPEGVIKFAHLSEAFAAELAYDQCAVALERLSVTTHHNILLSQCDLRARLREAYSKQSSEFSFNVVFPETQSKNKPRKKNDSEKSKIRSSGNCKHSAGETENNLSVLNDSNSAINVINGFPSDSTELEDVLQKPCEPSNLIDCLQSIAQCSESSVSRAASVDSLAETELGSSQQSALLLSPNKTSRPLNKTWSSRIMGWITDLQNIDPSSQVCATINDDVVTENKLLMESSVSSDKSTNLGFNQQSKPKSPSDVVSNTSSFVTCANGDLNSSFQSLPDEVRDPNDVRLVENKTLSPKSRSHNPGETSDEKTFKVNRSPELESTPLKYKDYSVSPMKRKNCSVLTQKVSLKSKRSLRSQSHCDSEVMDGEITIPLSPSPQTKTCSVLLNSVPELNEIAKNMSLVRTPAVALKRLNSSQYIDGNLETYQTKMINTVQNKAIKNKHSKKKIVPVRRSSRLTTQSNDKLSQSYSDQSSHNGTKHSKSSSYLVEKKVNAFKETESPLRTWLKKELVNSTNNHVTGSKESTKTIVCATTNKDVLISVGCSHMTCDYCYPDSTKLLLGFH